MYFIGKLSIYRTVSCPKVSDKNTTENSSSVSYCNKQAIAQCNSIVNDLLTAFALWTSTNTLLLDILDTAGYYEAVTINTIYAVPRPSAYKIATGFGFSDGLKGELRKEIFSSFF
jgi:hypothetical protein